MKKLTLFFTMALLVISGSSFAQSLQDLARQVQQQQQQENRINEQREREFVNARDRQRQLLAQARAELQAEERRSDALKAEYDENERQLAEQEVVLQERMGNLGELFGVVRQVAGDLQARLDNSMVSAQKPGRGTFLGDLAQRKELPTTRELRQLWSSMVEEIAEQGRVVRFTAPMIDGNGDRQENAEIVRVGVFNAISDGNFLVWDTAVGDGTLVQLARQPAGRFQSMASGLQGASGGNESMAVDFTSGVILSQVVKSKTPIERVKEDGGVVGWVIVGVAIVGLLFCLWKFLSLAGAGGKMKRQLKSETPDKSNALGRVMSVYTDNPNADIETLELKLDEAILRETAPIESGLSFIKVLYVIAPLLGLLGTVVGMINVFQQITLFGTGDPRMMAGGISTALVTTVLGLIAAIPLTIIHSGLQSKAKGLIQILEEQAAGIIANLAEKRDANTV